MITEFINRNSFLNKIHPNIKILSFFLLIFISFVPFGFSWQLITLFIVHIFWFLGKLKWKSYFKILVTVFLMFLLLFLINWITYKDPGVEFFEKNSKIISPNWWWKKDNFNSFGFFFNNDGNSMVSGYLWGAPNSDFKYLGITNIGNKFYLIQSANIDDLKSFLVGNHWKYILSTDNKYIYIYKSNWYSLSSYGMILSFYITLKIFTTILVVNILTSSTSPIELTYGFNELLSPLKYIKFPVNEVAMILTLSIRFIPSLLDESQRVLKAQASRGIDIRQGKFTDKWKALVSLLIPMFVISFRRSEELSNAMESRAYNPRLERSRYRYFELKIQDWFLLFFVSIFFGISIFFSFLHSIGHISFWFAPFGPLELTLLS